MSLNPYQSPSFETSRVPEDAVYYETDTTKLTLREFWRISNGLFEFLLAAAMWLLRVRIPINMAFANTTYLQLISPEHLSEAVRKPLGGIVEHAQQLELAYQFTYALPAVGNLEGVGAGLINPQRNILMVASFARTWVNNVLNEKLSYGFLTRLENGTVLATSGSSRDLDTPPNIIGESHPKREMKWVLERHQQRMSESTSRAVAFGEGEQLLAEVRQYEQMVFGYQIERGVYVPVDLAKLERIHAEASPPPSGSKPAMSSHGMLDIIFVVMLGLSAFLQWKQPAENVQQQIFRLSLAAIGVVGIIALWVTRMIRANRSS